MRECSDRTLRRYPQASQAPEGRGNLRLQLGGVPTHVPFQRYFAVRNGWYVAAFTHEATRTLLSRWILNEPVVIYRKEDGEAVALSGRCPHRHFPLGKGCLKGDTVECGYHGITFGPDGHCTSGRDFYLPGFHAGIDLTSIPQDHPTRAGEELRHARVFHAVTPGQTHTTHYFFGMGGRMTEEDLDFMQGYLQSVVAEDVMATEEIETTLTRLEREPSELMLKSDTTAVLDRRALAAMMEREG